MIRTLFWKEYRDQRLFALLLVAFAGGLVALVPIAAPMLKIPSQDVIAVQQGVLFLFAVICGVVSGALHWSVERENGTETFLDMMPVPRSTLWRTKTVYAIGQWALQMLALAAIALVFGTIDTNETDNLARVVLGFSALSLTITIATSSWSRTVLGAIGRAIPFGLVVAYGAAAIFFVTARLLFLKVSPVFANGSRMTFVLGVLWTIAILAMPLWFSYRRLTAIDRARSLRVEHIASPGRRAFMTAWKLASHDLRSLAWPVGVLLAAMAFLAGQEPTLAWLLIGSLLGAWLGVSVTDAEKHGGAFKLWADQRLPVGRLWCVKVLHRLVLLLVCSIAIVFIVAGTIFLQIQAKGGSVNPTFATAMTSALSSVTAPWTLMLLGPLFGLGAGLVFALITPKKVISILGAGLAALALTIFWLPMVGSGGIRLWQWLGVPLGLAITARVIVWPWATGRLSTRATIAGLVVPMLAIAGYWYGVEQARVAAVPYLGSLVDEDKFMSVMRSTQAAQAGDRLNEVAGEVLTLRSEAVSMPKPVVGIAGGMVDSAVVLHAPMGKPSYEEFRNQLNFAFPNGLKEIKPEVRKAFDKILADGWVKKIEALAAADVEYANLGTIELDSGVYTGFEKRTSIQFAGEMLLIDALRKEEAGDAAGALARIDQALRVSRWIGRRVPAMFHYPSASLNTSALKTHDFWRSRRTSKADVVLLRLANAMIERHRIRSESDEDMLKSQYLSMKSSASDTRSMMSEWMTRYDIRNRDETWTSLSAHLWSVATGTEFETLRRQRLYDLWIAGFLKSARTDHLTLHRLASAHGNNLAPAYFYGERYFNFGDWVSPTIENPSPAENQADWERTAELIHQDIYFRSGALPYTARTTRDIARKKAIFEMIALMNALQAHRILHGDWPKSLAELDAPGFGQVPDNPLTGTPYVYEVFAKGVVLKAPDVFPNEKPPSTGNFFDHAFSNRRYALVFETPSFEVK
ncbi:hypothetical protein GC170_22115 [bacterium]|nr:hypothetical protein [bacterium]